MNATRLLKACLLGSALLVLPPAQAATDPAHGFFSKTFFDDDFRLHLKLHNGCAHERFPTILVALVCRLGIVLLQVLRKCRHPATAALDPSLALENPYTTNIHHGATSCLDIHTQVSLSQQISLSTFGG